MLQDGGMVVDDTQDVRSPLLGPNGICLYFEDSEDSDFEDSFVFTPSVASSVDNYKTETGRRYHAFGEGAVSYLVSENHVTSFDVATLGTILDSIEVSTTQWYAMFLSFVSTFA